MGNQPYRKSTRDTHNSAIPQSKAQTYFSEQGTSVASTRGRNAKFSVTTSSPNSTIHQDDSLAQIMANQIEETKKFNAQVSELKKEIEKTKDFYKSITKLSKISHWAIILLLVIPVLQVFACGIIVYYLGVQDELSPIINWMLGGVSIASIIEIITFFIKMSDWEKRLQKLENEKDTSQ